ncbi:uncharacterized protein DUF4262 [Nonomuraea polychroma]|uniref:Uncharacterized protein DUF4262 n=1 Tax=Nonomuraea polychroma TaxID=46176 RepID=A0A438MCT3_9ACTN|nr:DUF4262 domain-containing protein [Nonomuraea polychroma]RVX43497.1 uncharacterized protein DUF4262 [Nonomuraea polychroma]
MPFITVVLLSGTIMQVTQQHCRCIICEPVNDPLNRFQEAMMGYIGEHGWGVSDIADDDIGPGWAYTVGLWHTFGLPEVAIFGLDTDLRQSCLNFLADDIQAGYPIATEQERSEILEGVRVLLKSMHPSWYEPLFGEYGSLFSFYQRTPRFPILQLVWPDTEGLFAWQSGSDPLLAQLQPSL